MSWNDLELKVIRWAEARKIIPNATPISQLLKAVSEIGELCDAEGKRDQAAIKDAVGDVLVCLINYCELRGISIVKCLEGAYDQIKDRKGTLMPDGTFVKEQQNLC
jgi:NTP pyrophosphatase (non-canonical NTP hydrolase)